MLYKMTVMLYNDSIGKFFRNYQIYQNGGIYNVYYLS